MTVLARRALNEDCATVVTLLGHAMRRALTARLAGECDAIGFFIFAALGVLSFTLCIGLVPAG